MKTDRILCSACGALLLSLPSCVTVDTPGTVGAPPTAMPGAAPAPAPAGDALVPGTSYHATGTIPASMGGGQPTGQWQFGVTREGNGTATVTVTKPDGRQRNIFFQNGSAIGADTSQADPGAFSATRQADLTIVRIGEERYEIPDAVIYGG